MVQPGDTVSLSRDRPLSQRDPVVAEWDSGVVGRDVCKDVRTRGPKEGPAVAFFWRPVWVVQSMARLQSRTNEPMELHGAGRRRVALSPVATVTDVTVTCEASSTLLEDFVLPV